MRITDSTKYLAREVSTNQAITQGTRRQDAFAVVRLLGERFYVYNRVTRRRSNE